MKDYIPEINRLKVQQVIEAGQDFMDRNVPVQTPRLNLIADQLRYISKLFWGCQILILVAAIFAAAALPREFENADRLMLMMAPFACFLAVPEMFKDLYWDMSELENVCKNSSSTIFLIRLMIVGLANVFTLTVAAGIFAGAFEEAFGRIVICGLVPFVWENAACLLLVKLLPVKSRSGAAALCIIPALTVAAVSSSVPPDNHRMQLMWLAAAAAGALLVAAETGFIMRERKEGVFLWNLK